MFHSAVVFVLGLIGTTAFGLWMERRGMSDTALIITMCACLVGVAFATSYARRLGQRHIRGGRGKRVAWIPYLIVGMLIGGAVGVSVYFVRAWRTDILWTFNDPASIDDPYFLGFASSGGQEAYVITFQARGRNNTGRPINEFDGFIRSTRTNEQVAVRLNFNGVLVTSKQVNGIPPDTTFDLNSVHFPSNVESRPEGLGITQFLIDYPSFTFVFTYDGKTYERQFSNSEIRHIIDLFEADRAAGASTNEPRIMPRP